MRSGQDGYHSVAGFGTRSAGKTLETASCKWKIASKKFDMDVFKEGSDKNVLKFSKPINFQSVNVHHVILKNRDMMVGNKKKTK